MRRSARRAQEYADAARRSLFDETNHRRRRAMGREHARFALDAEFLQLRETGLEPRQIGVGAHQ